MSEGTPDVTTHTRSVKVLGLPGSLRRNSYNRLLLQAATHLAPSAMAVTVYQHLNDIPIFSEDLEGPASDPDGVVRLREAVEAADGILIATPEYNQSVPGGVKNMIDWLSRSPTGSLSGKPVSVTGITTGPWGTRLAQATLRQMLTSAQALVLPQPALYLANAAAHFDSRGNITDPDIQQRLTNLLTALGDWTRLNLPESVDRDVPPP